MAAAGERPGSSGPPGCASRACLEAHEGEVVCVEGVYLYPGQRAFAVNRLRLPGDVTIVLSPPPEDLRGDFSPANHGRPMRVTGRIFCGPIPDRYRIIGRTPEPHLLEVEAVALAGPGAAE